MALLRKRPPIFLATLIGLIKAIGTETGGFLQFPAFSSPIASNVKHSGKLSFMAVWNNDSATDSLNLSPTRKAFFHTPYPISIPHTPYPNPSPSPRPKVECCKVDWSAVEWSRVWSPCTCHGQSNNSINLLHCVIGNMMMRPALISTCIMQKKNDGSGSSGSAPAPAPTTASSSSWSRSRT